MRRLWTWHRFLPLMAVESELEKGSLVRILLPEADIHLSLQLVYHRKNGCHNQ